MHSKSGSRLARRAKTSLVAAVMILISREKHQRSPIVTLFSPGASNPTSDSFKTHCKINVSFHQLYDERLLQMHTDVTMRVTYHRKVDTSDRLPPGGSVQKIDISRHARGIR